MFGLVTICYVIVCFFLSANNCLASLNYTCIHDRIVKNSGEMPASIIYENSTPASRAWRATMAAASEWKPIRFRAFGEDLINPLKFCTSIDQLRPNFEDIGSKVKCTERDILTSEKKALLTRNIFPNALRLHIERLLVMPLDGKIQVPKYAKGFCSTFSIPSSHRDVGVSGADMVMYIASGPTGGNTIGWAGKCSRHKDGRPIVGVSNFGPHALHDTRETIRLAAHEIAHALGFDAISMQDKGLLTEVKQVRGRDRLMVTSKMTVLKVREHFKCDTAVGMELEDEGGPGTQNSHWERRNAKDELMCGISDTGGSYSKITMALFEDLGYYKANWEMAEGMKWGAKAGCDFLTEKCVEDGQTKYPNMFCTGTGRTERCSTDLRGLGLCRLYKHDNPLPDEYQYFNETNIGGSSSDLTDYCPIIHVPNHSFCNDKSEEVEGFTSLCLKGEKLIAQKVPVGDICAEASCKGNKVFVRYKDDPEWTPCPEGEKIKLKKYFSKGSIVCPSHRDVCSFKKKKDIKSYFKGIEEKPDTPIDYDEDPTQKDPFQDNEGGENDEMNEDMDIPKFRSKRNKRRKDSAVSLSLKIAIFYTVIFTLIVVFP